MRRALVVVLIFALVPVILSPSSGAQHARSDGRYVVVLEDTASAPDVAARLRGGKVEALFGAVNTLVMSLPHAGLEGLRRDPQVAYAAPDRLVRLLASDVSEASPAVSSGVARIGAAPVAGLGRSAGEATGAKKAAVAIVDTGVMKRPDLNVVGGVDCVAGSDGDSGDGMEAATIDRVGHGTHVAGVVAGQGSPGVIGVSPGTPLYAVRVFDDGTARLSAVLCGLDWVARHAAGENIKVMNLSLGGRGRGDGDCGRSEEDPLHTEEDPLHTAVCRLTAVGVTIVAAAGNDGADLAHTLPAAYPEVLAVTAMADFDGRPGGHGSPPPDCRTSNRDDAAAGYSDYAVPGSATAERTIAAPGDCITSAWNDGKTRTLSGTSMASPHVAGLVARCIDAGPCAGMTPAQIIVKLLADATSGPPEHGFVGDPSHPEGGRYYGYLASAGGY